LQNQWRFCALNPCHTWSHEVEFPIRLQGVFMSFKVLNQYLIIAVFFAAIAACSGGGGGSDTTQAVTPSGSVTTGVTPSAPNGTDTMPSSTGTTTPVTPSTPNGSTSTTPTLVKLDVSIIAGALGGSGYANGTGSTARFASINDIAYEGDGNLLVADSSNLLIRRITPAGEVSNLRGDFPSINSLTVRGDGTVVYADNTRIYSVSSTGAKTVLAGANSSGTADGAGAVARLNTPAALTYASDGTLYFADLFSNTIRMMSTSGIVTTIAGSGQIGNVDGIGTAASFARPSGLALNNNGTLLYVADTENYRIRIINIATKNVSHFAGSTTRLSGNSDGNSATSRFDLPKAMRMTPSSTLIVADANNNLVRSVTSAGLVTTIAGKPRDFASSSAPTGSADGQAVNATFRNPAVLAVSPDGLTVAIGDTLNNTVRTLSAGNVSTLAGLAPQIGTADGAGTTARFSGEFSGLAVLPGAAMVGAVISYDTGLTQIRRISAEGIVSTDASTVPQILAMAANSAGDVYYSSRSQVFRLGSTGVSTAIAGDALLKGYQDGAGTAARFSNPRALAVAADGAVYVFDEYRVRKISPAGVVSTIAGDGVRGATDGTGTAARLSDIRSLALDSAGNIIAVGDSYRKVTPAGVVTTVTLNANCYVPVTVDAADNVYCTTGSRMKRISPSGVEKVLVDYSSDGFSILRTGNTNASLNATTHINLLSETATSLIFVLADKSERVLLKAILDK
jgi:NHL repeat